MGSRRLRILCGLAGAALGAFVCFAAATLRFTVSDGGLDLSFLARSVPLPHQIPQYSGGLSLRLAMVHDVIHERFPKHGPAHYEARNQLSRRQLAELSDDDPDRYSHADDLGAGLDRLGRSAEAVEIIRDKLQQQQAAGLAGRALYTSYANLGTFLIHESLPQARLGDAAAYERFQEGVEFIRKSVQVNPEAHFGRERWQAAIAEFLLAAIQDPSLLQTFDCLGNRLDKPTKQILDRAGNWVENGYGHTVSVEFTRGELESEFPAWFREQVDLSDPEAWAEVQPLRQQIVRVGAEQGWQQVDVPSHRQPVPFDEPVLGIIGMWRQGGGANPHFALALAETMLRVGQRYIAWTAYERAAELAENYWPDPDLQQFLIGHCRLRQQQLEESAGFLTPPSDPATVTAQTSAEEVSSPQQLRQTFQAELDYGRQYQDDYQQFEAAQLQSGRPLQDPDFFEEFHQQRPAIASQIGRADVFVYVPKAARWEFQRQFARSWAILGAGIGGFVSVALVSVVTIAFRRFRHRSGHKNFAAELPGND